MFENCIACLLKSWTQDLAKCNFECFGLVCLDIKQSSRQLILLWVFGLSEMIFHFRSPYFVLLNSFNFEASHHTSSYIRYAWLSECWSWAINETFTTCTVCWGGIAEDGSSVKWYIFFFCFPPAEFTLKFISIILSDHIKFIKFCFSSFLSGYISYSSSASFLVPRWLTKDSSFYSAARILSH